MKNHIFFWITFVFLINLSELLYSQASPEEIYFRCHFQMLKKEPALTSSLLNDVRSKKISAQDACIQLLSSVKLNSSGQLISPNFSSNVAILNRFNQIHHSWFLNRDYNKDENQLFMNVKRSFFDPTGPALFLTEALFSERPIHVADLFSDDKSLEPRRSKGKAADLINLERSIFSQTFGRLDTAQYGNILAIESKDTLRLEYDIGSPSVRRSTDVTTHFGGGILGSSSYLQTTTVFPDSQSDETNQLDGGVRVLRQFGVAVMNDFLCRDFPAAYVTDVESSKFYNVSSPIPFRENPHCAVCHATMDQLAGAVRNIESKRIGETVSTNDQLGIPVLSRNPSSSPKPSLAAYWHDRVDPDYRNRPATGNLFYRASDGSLVDLPFVGLGGLGNLLADQDDLYRCITKRYYEFFIGVKVPMSFTAENLAQDPHRATINNLALELKDHGSLKKTIYEIIKSTEYRKK